MKSIASWFRGTAEFKAVAEGRSADGRQARTAARAELRSARAAVNPAIATEAGIPDLRRKVAEAAEALRAARAALEAADQKVSSSAASWAARVEKAESAVNATANARLREFRLLLRNLRDQVRRGIVRPPSGVAPDLAKVDAYHAAILADFKWASATIAEDHSDEEVEREIAKRLARTRADLLLDPAPGESAR